MIELLETKEKRKSEHKEWSNEFLLPLTGLKKNDKYNINSYMFWKDNNINDYKLVITMDGGIYEDMVQYARDVMFPILDKKGYLLENYDVDGMIIFILDMSEWAWDIDRFIEGRYSKLSSEAKKLIEKYHTNSKNQISMQLIAILYPNKPQTWLNKMTPIQYAADIYGLNLDDMEKLGELGSLYNILDETLITDINDLID